jgi:hypothetical protein
MLSPIVLFVYNRPWHTEQTLNALAENYLSDQSILYVFADGPKENADEEMMLKINQTRAIVKSKQWCKEVIIMEHKKNIGLSRSIIGGVTNVVNKHGAVIVLEDDIVAAKGFLKYMNDALTYYLNEEKVGCIHAWNYKLDCENIEDSTFFLKGADCWGWATWKNSWELFNPNGEELLNAIIENKSEHDFNRKGTHDFIGMLKDQIYGMNDSWAIRWHASLFLENKYCLQPTRAIVKNIGLDSSGVHCETSDLSQELVEYIPVGKIKLQESKWFFKAFNNSFNQSTHSLELSKWQKLKAFLKHSLHQ